MKTYTKRYTTKSGEVKEYTYPVGKLRKGKNYILVDKSGKIHKENVQRLLDSYDLTTDEGMQDYFYTSQIVKGFHKAPLERGHQLTVSKIKAVLTADKYEKMFINSGYSLEEAADEIGTSSDALTDKDNWNGSIFTDPDTGEKYEFQINYRGSCWTAIGD